MKKFILSAQKGGKGKSLLTALIANSLAIDYHKKVLVIDADEQGTLTDVRTEDQDYADEFPYEIHSIPVTKVVDFLDDLDSNQYDVVFIDMQGSISDEDLIEVLMEANLVLLPIVAQQADLLSDKRYIQTIKQIEEYKLTEQDIDFKLFAVINRKRGWLEEKQIASFCQDIGVDMFESTLRDLTIYSRFNTYESYVSSESKEIDKVRDEFKIFMDELVEKFNL